MSTAAAGPLDGIKVLEVGGIGPGPFAAMMLSDMGAEVLRVDRPGGALMGALDTRHDTLHRGRRSAMLDVRDPRGLATLLALVDRADVLLETARPGVAERLGFGPEVCLERNDRLVYARMTGWGQDGPLAQSAGHDLTYIARTGALFAVGVADHPVVPLNLVGDFGGGGAFCVIGITAGLLEVARGGKGQVVDVAITEGTALLTTGIRQMVLDGLWDDRREHNLMDGACPWYTTYSTSDGRHVAVAALEPKFYDELLSLLGLQLDHDRTDPETWPHIRQALAARFARGDLAHWESVFSGSDACVAPVLTFAEAAGDPHLAARGAFVEHDGVLQPAPAPRFSRTPGSIRSAPVQGGTHTREALLEWGVQDVEELLTDGVALQA
jgi:alpha-methylacyl-CoA racemase